MERGERERERKGWREEESYSCLSIIRARVWPTNRYISRSSIAVVYPTLVCHRKAETSRCRPTINIGKVKRLKRINKCSLRGRKAEQRDFEILKLPLSRLQLFFFENDPPSPRPHNLLRSLFDDLLRGRNNLCPQLPKDRACRGRAAMESCVGRNLAVLFCSDKFLDKFGK